MNIDFTDSCLTNLRKSLINFSIMKSNYFI